MFLSLLLFLWFVP